MPKCKACGKQVSLWGMSFSGETTCHECYQAKLMKDRPPPVIRPLDLWRAEQIKRLGTIILPCPLCRTEVQLAEICSHCGESMADTGRKAAKVNAQAKSTPGKCTYCGKQNGPEATACAGCGTTLVMKAETSDRSVKNGGNHLLKAKYVIFFVVCLVSIMFVTIIFHGISNGAFPGVGIGIIVSLFGLYMARHLWREFRFSIVFSDISPREKWLRFARQVEMDDSLSKEVKAKVYGFSLCQPYVRFSELFASINPELVLFFWLRENSAKDIASTTRAVLNDLVFVEALDNCRAHGYVPGDRQLECMIATASDSPQLLQAAELILKELPREWLQRLIGFISKKIGWKARDLLVVLDGGKSRLLPTEHSRQPELPVTQASNNNSASLADHSVPARQVSTETQPAKAVSDTRICPRCGAKAVRNTKGVHGFCETVIAGVGIAACLIPGFLFYLFIQSVPLCGGCGRRVWKYYYQDHFRKGKGKGSVLEK